MASKPLTRASFIDQCESILQDGSNATFSAAELGLILDDVLVEVSEAVPYVMKDVYTLETRTGSASSTSANNLVDTGKSQFASGDVGKNVFNKDDNTWAVITSHSSTSQVGLSADIFTVGERYEIYNEGCWSKKQINIKNSQDFLWIVGVEYPVDRATYSRGRQVNWKLYDRNTILELDVGYVDDTSETNAEKDVFVYFARQHKLNAMTDLAGELSAGPSAAATSIAVDGLQTGEATSTLYKDTLLYFTTINTITANSRLIYRVTADATISTEGAATLLIWPPLENALTDNDDVAFIKSTLPTDIERLAIQIVVGEALMSKSIKNIDNIVTGEGVSQKQFQTGERIAEKARARLHRKVDVNLRADRVYGR